MPEVVEQEDANPTEGHRLALCHLLIETGFWPPNIEFLSADLNTCISIMNEQRQRR